MKIKFFSIVTALLISSAAAASDLQLQTIGVSGGSNLFLTYLSIGVIADSYTKEVYGREQTALFVNSIISHAEVQKNYMDKQIK